MRKLYLDFFKSKGHYKLLQSHFFVLQHVAIPDYNISFIALPTAHPFYLFLLLNRTLISFANIQSFKSIEIQIKSID